ncbi:MAG: CoA activase [Actinobacteria bacterium]|nr:CoA activase [Actinomycetota bacterium]
MPYRRHMGNPLQLIKEDLGMVREKMDDNTGAFSISFTGSGAKELSVILGVPFVNEIEAITSAVKNFEPGAGSVIEIGGQDSKFIDTGSGDYSMNELCAAGTGSFLDQQASRFGLTIEEFALLALNSKNPSTIAGRCSVFAKTDMIHLQQEAASDEDIAMGLCHAMARSFKSGIARGRDFMPPVLFCGGVSFNKAMIKAFSDITGKDIKVPPHHYSMGAIGACLAGASKRAGMDRGFSITDLIGKINDYQKNYRYKSETFSPLKIVTSTLPDVIEEKYGFDSGRVEAYIGIDVGSISTNVVAIDSSKKLIAKKYLRTAGRPIEAVRSGIREIYSEVGDKIIVKGAGTTGSGRYLIGDLVGADIVINEITAQATAAANIDSSVDTIFEIGGQDSKYISLENGVVVDFEMNKVCAAGTGSFLEEQSERFNIDIKDFGDIALRSESPVNLGERCTVFMETNVYSHYQKGASIEDILAGLAYSITMNYINRVVGRKKIGNRIFFQGAVAYNRAVIAAFENYINRPIIVPRHHEVTGAIGTAIRAMEAMTQGTAPTKFRGFEGISKISYSHSSFECKGCPNHCEIKRISIKGQPPLYYGGRCEKYEKREVARSGLPDYFAEREEILLNSYQPSEYIKNRMHGDGNGEGKPKVGIPYSMLTHEFYPFWKAYFTELEFDLVLSDRTNKKIINDGVQMAVAETCFPMKATLGHVQNLIEKGVDYLFLPVTRDMPTKESNIKGDRTGSYPCPFIQGTWSIVKASMDTGSARVLTPVFNFSFKEYIKEKQLVKFGMELGRNRRSIKRAIEQAYLAQDFFYSTIRQKGAEMLGGLKDGEIAIVISSRSYNSCDRAISMDVPRKLQNLGLKVIPLDYLPLNSVDLSGEWPNLYWEFGDRIMSSVKIIKEIPGLYPVYITNFGCGPDSFIMQYFEREIDRPFLKLEVDEHSGGAGVITRCEAFVDSLMNIRKKQIKSIPVETPKIREAVFKKSQGRTIYIPFMSDGAVVLKHAFRSAGIEAEMLNSDDETLKWGRRYTLGKECYPFIITTGDIIKTLRNNDPQKAAFLMPQTYGPCRFGQYNRMQKIIIRELGYEGIPIISPGAPESGQFYREYDMNGIRGFGILLKAFLGILTIDYLNKCLRQTRPYETGKGRTDSIYNSYIERVCSHVENDPLYHMLGRMVGLLEEARREFEGIPVNRTAKPLVGIVGEIFVRNHPYSNNEIIRKVEALGGEVEMPTISEWPEHTTATRKIDIITRQTNLYYSIMKLPWSSGRNGSGPAGKNGSYFELLGDLTRGSGSLVLNRIMDRYLIHWNHALSKPLKGFLREEKETGIYEVWDNAEPYIIKWFGEAALSVGKSVDWIKKGADGIINVLPFTCIPGNIVNAVSRRIKEDYHVPWLNLAFDGLEQGTTETRLEAFMYQAGQHLDSRKQG